MSRMSQEMRTILDALQVSTVANLPAMETGEARSAFATAAADWNVPLPDLEAEDVVLDGVPCRILVPASRKRGTVVFVHGGGWTFGSPATHERFARLLAIYSATTVVVPEYRLAPEAPCLVAIEDVARAVHAISSVHGAEGPLAAPGGKPERQRSKVQRSQHLERKLSSLAHRFTFFPRHLPAFYASFCLQSVTYVLNLLCYLCPEPAPERRTTSLPCAGPAIPADDLAVNEGSRG